MYNIVIGIPTYRRPLMLQKLLRSINGCRIDFSQVKEVNIIIIDNDIEKTAKEIVSDISSELNEIYRVNYFNFPIKGLSNVRNEIFKRAYIFNPDYIICIDDDEYPGSDWIMELIGAITHINKPDIVLGPVIPVFETDVSPYIKYWFKYLKLEDHQSVDFFWTGNFIIRTDFLIKHGLKFDERFNSTGSEDSYFGVKAIDAGAKICWSAKAVAYETIPSKRAKLKWLLKRSYNGALTFNYILKLKHNYYRLMRKTIVSSMYLIIGTLALVTLLLPFKWKYWGILKLSEGAGGFAGLFGIRFHEYAQDR